MKEQFYLFKKVHSLLNGAKPAFWYDTHVINNYSVFANAQNSLFLWGYTMLSNTYPDFDLSITAQLKGRSIFMILQEDADEKLGLAVLRRNGIEPEIIDIEHRSVGKQKYKFIAIRAKEKILSVTDIKEIFKLSTPEEIKSSLCVNAYGISTPIKYLHIAVRQADNLLKYFTLDSFDHLASKFTKVPEGADYILVNVQYPPDVDKKSLAILTVQDQDYRTLGILDPRHINASSDSIQIPLNESIKEYRFTLTGRKMINILPSVIEFKSAKRND